MTAKKRSYIVYLQDMLDAMYRIESYIQGLNFKEFQESNITVDAVIRNLEVIGEVANHIPDNVKAKKSGSTLETDVCIEKFCNS